MHKVHKYHYLPHLLLKLTTKQSHLPLELTTIQSHLSLELTMELLSLLFNVF